MAPRCACHQAGMGDGLREKRVARQRVRFGIFAGVHVGFAGVAGRTNEKARLGFAQKLQQEIIARVIEFFARERGKGLLALAQGLRESLPDITCGAEEDSHESKV